MPVIDFSMCMLGSLLVVFYGEFIKYIDGGSLMEGVRVYSITTLVFPSLCFLCGYESDLLSSCFGYFCSHASLPLCLLPLLNLLPLESLA